MRKNIIDAAMNICLKEGWQAMSMRKISLKIHATAPVIYQYFHNKEAITAELSAIGFRRLQQTMVMAQTDAKDAEHKLKEIGLAYWVFTIKYTPLYQLMFGIGANISATTSPHLVIQPLVEHIGETMSHLPQNYRANEPALFKKAYLLWAFIHGLASLRITNNSLTENEYLSILTDNILIFSSINN